MLCPQSLAEYRLSLGLAKASISASNASVLHDGPPLQESVGMSCSRSGLSESRYRRGLVDSLIWEVDRGAKPSIEDAAASNERRKAFC